MMIGIGMPISQRSAPFPKPTVISYQCCSAGKRVASATGSEPLELSQMHRRWVCGSIEGIAMRKRPNLIGVRIVPWEMDVDVFGIVCEYDDGIETREVWGTYEETEIAATLRQRDIVSAMNLRRA
jgi:hypothetical protein